MEYMECLEFIPEILGCTSSVHCFKDFFSLKIYIHIYITIFFFVDRNRKDSITSSIVMNEQYRQEQSRGNRSRQGSITSTSTMRSYKGEL